MENDIKEMMDVIETVEGEEEELDEEIREL